jgi:hypothetical protein
MIMTTTEPDLANDVFGASTVNEKAKSLFGQIGDAIQDSKRDQHLDLAIPGTNELLWARYRPFPVAKTEAKTDEMRRAHERGRPVMLQAACDTLVDACEQLYVLPPEFEGDPGNDGENLIPIDDTIPVRFERRLVELFLKPKGIDTGHIKTAREVVLSIFPTEQSIIASNVEVSTWMMNLNRRTNADAVGE